MRRLYSRSVVGERPSLVICFSHLTSSWSTVMPAPAVLPLLLPSNSLTSFASALSAVVTSESSAAYPGHRRLTCPYFPVTGSRPVATRSS